MAIREPRPQKLLNLVAKKYKDLVIEYDQKCSLQNEYEFHFPKEPECPTPNWNSNSFAKLPAL